MYGGCTGLDARLGVADWCFAALRVSDCSIQHLPYAKWRYTRVFSPHASSPSDAKRLQERALCSVHVRLCAVVNLGDAPLKFCVTLLSLLALA